MQHSVLFREQRSVSSFGDCGGNSLVAEFDEAQSVGDLRAPRTAAVQRPGGWISKMARAFASMTKAEARPLLSADHGIHQLSKGWAKRMHLAVGGRISCRTGRVWITLDEGGEDIVLTAGESKSFDPGACVLVEALAASRVSLEAI
jgi:hypothetical protein